jgi:hypothetical protein
MQTDIETPLVRYFAGQKVSPTFEKKLLEICDADGRINAACRIEARSKSVMASQARIELDYVKSAYRRQVAGVLSFCGGLVLMVGLLFYGEGQTLTSLHSIVPRGLWQFPIIAWGFVPILAWALVLGCKESGLGANVSRF